MDQAVVISRRRLRTMAMVVSWSTVDSPLDPNRAQHSAPRQQVEQADIALDAGPEMRPTNRDVHAGAVKVRRAHD